VRKQAGGPMDGRNEGSGRPQALALRASLGIGEEAIQLPSCPVSGCSNAAPCGGGEVVVHGAAFVAAGEPGTRSREAEVRSPPQKLGRSG
jgi:hypothetical protein